MNGDGGGGGRRCLLPVAAGSQAKMGSSSTRRYFFFGGGGGGGRGQAATTFSRGSHSSETSSAYSGSSELTAATAATTCAAAGQDDEVELLAHEAGRDFDGVGFNRDAEEDEDDSADEDDDDMPMVDADADEDDNDDGGDGDEALRSATSATATAALERPPTVLDALRKPPVMRQAAEVAALVAAFQQLRGFADFTRPAVGQLAESAIGGEAAPSETLLADGRELDSWFVIVSGEAEIVRPGSRTEQLSVGDAFGARPQQQQQQQQQQGRQKQVGTVRALSMGCVFARVPLPELQRVLTAEACRTVEIFGSDGALFLVREIRPAPPGSPTQQLQVTTRGTPRGLLDQLGEPRCELTDPGFTEDFLLTYPALFHSGLPVAKRLLSAAGGEDLPERRTRAVRVLLTWAGSYFEDFATNPELFGVLLRLDQLLGAAGGEEANGERRLLRLACSAGSASCRNPEPPLVSCCSVAATASAAAAPSSDTGFGDSIASCCFEDDDDFDIDDVDDADASGGADVQLLRVHRPDGRRRLLRLPRGARVADIVVSARRSFGLTSLVVGDDPEADDAVDCGDAALSGYRLLEVSVAPGPLVRRRALAPALLAAGLAPADSPRVRYYLAGPREPPDLCLARDEEARQLMAQVEAAGCRQSGPTIDYFITANAKQIASRLTDADFQLHRQIRPRQLIDWWLRGGGGGAVGGPLQALMSATQSESTWAAAVVTQILPTASSAGPMSRRQLLALKQLLRVCRHCWRIGNLNSLMSLALAVMAARSSLEPLCHRLGKKYRQFWRSLETITDVSMNHAAYRQLVRTGRSSDRSVGQVQKQQQLLPYLAILCKDLAALRECGELQNRSGSNGLVNFERLRLLAREIRNFCYLGADLGSCQSHPQLQQQQQQQLKSPQRFCAEEERKVEDLIAQIRGMNSS